MGEAISSVTADDFDAVLARSEVPVLIDFWAPSCGPCKAMLPALEDVVEDYAGELVVATMNIEAHPAIAERFDARTIPLLVLFKSGAEVARSIGAMSKTRLCAFIDTHLEASS